MARFLGAQVVGEDGEVFESVDPVEDVRATVGAAGESPELIDRLLAETLLRIANPKLDRIAQRGLDPKRRPVWVSRDIKAAEDAVGPNRFEIRNQIARDPGVVVSDIAKSLWAALHRGGGMETRPYKGVHGSQLKSSEETLLRSPEAVEAFNRGISGTRPFP